MLKILIYRIIVYSGIFRLWLFKNRNAVNILMLHGIMDKSLDDSWEPFWNRISPDFLGSRLEYLSRYYQFITLDEAVDILSGRKPVKPNCMVLTFDDGYRNNLKYAMPILRKYNVPATIYIVTEYISKQIPFQIDRLDYALNTIELRGRKFEVKENVVTYDTTSREKLKKSYMRHRELIQSASKSEQDYLGRLDELALELETESADSIYNNFQQDDWINILTWDQIHDYRYTDVQFEGHTAHHYKLALLEPDHIRVELSVSKKEIERILGNECKHLCYPVGSYNQTVIEIAKSCGYESAVTIEEGLNHVGCDLFRLHRMPFPYEGDVWANIISLSGFSSYISSVIRRLRGLPRI